MAKKSKRTTADAKKAAARKKVQGSLRLADFLIQLAIKKDVRERFDKDPVGTLEALPKPLTDEARDAILLGKRAQVLNILNINQQDH